MWIAILKENMAADVYQAHLGLREFCNFSQQPLQNFTTSYYVPTLVPKPRRSIFAQFC